MSISGSRRGLKWCPLLKNAEKPSNLPGLPWNWSGMTATIFAIMGRAAKLLRENGQNAESLEMRRRVTHCDNYYKALGIISEYVETELSVPRDLSHDPAHIRKEKKRGGEER